MIDGIRVKLCGLTTLVDVEFADDCGVDYLGFNLYSKSPRHIALAQFKAMSARLPDRKKVAIMVMPSAAELSAAAGVGFDFFQIHFPLETPAATIASWGQTVGTECLWLAPKLPPGADVPADVLAAAKFFLFDTFHAEGFGGSGKTGDWANFARHQQRHPDKTWILAGGLNPENIGDALKQSGARYVDVNSGVEVSPGVKDHAKLKRFVEAIRQFRMGRKS